MMKVPNSNKKTKFFLNKLMVLVLMLIISLSLTACNSSTNKDEETKPAKPEVDYTSVETLLGESESEIVEVTDFSFESTNPSDSAIAGSGISYWANITGKNAEGENIEEIHESITISEETAEDNYDFIRSNLIIILDNFEGEKSIEVAVTFADQSKTYDYEVIRQTISDANFNMLINKYTVLPEDYVPSDLTKSDAIYYTNGYSSSVSAMQRECTDAIEKLILAAKAEGFTIYACSGYRDYYVQQYLYNNAVAAYGSDQMESAPPGASEHQTGFAMDVIFPDTGMDLYESQENSPSYTWMRENAHKYGFILRYERGEEDVTGYIFEPWHYRYLGVETATEYHEGGFTTLEEFLSIPR